MKTGSSAPLRMPASSSSLMPIPRLMRSCWYTSYVASDSTPTRTMAISRSTGSSLDLNSRWLPKRLNARSRPSPPASMRKMFIGGSPIFARVSCVSGSSDAGSGYGMRAMASIIAHRRARWERRAAPAVPSWRHHLTTQNGSTQMALTIASQKTIHETHRVAEDGAVDADGHILEPPTLWEEYIDPKFRDRALLFKLDEKGLEELWYDGQRLGAEPSWLPVDARRDGRARPRRHGRRTRTRTYLGEAPYGSMHPQERVDVLDAEHIDTPILYTTVGLLWEAEVKDPALSQAYTTAYNRWICEFCADEPRLVPTAHLSLTDVDAAAQGAGASRRGGRQGRLRRPVPPRRPAVRPPRQRPDLRRRPGPRRAAGDPPDVRAAVDEGHPDGRLGERQATCACCRRWPASDGVRHQFTTLFDYGVFDKFPRLKVLVLESGAGWIGYWLDRIDAVLQPHRASASGCRSSTSRATTSASGSGSAATPTSG